MKPPSPPSPTPPLSPSLHLPTLTPSTSPHPLPHLTLPGITGSSNQLVPAKVSCGLSARHLSLPCQPHHDVTATHLYTSCGGGNGGCHGNRGIVPWLFSVPATRKVYLRDLSSETTFATTQRQCPSNTQSVSQGPIILDYICYHTKTVSQQHAKCISGTYHLRLHLLPH